MSMLRVQNLYKTYPSFALKDVSFSLESGRIMGLIGKNGAGKSTTLKAMLGMVSPDSGKVEMLGEIFTPTKHSANKRSVSFSAASIFTRKSGWRRSRTSQNDFTRIGTRMRTRATCRCSRSTRESA